MMTIEGARALGIDHQVGSLEPGKQADLIAVNFNQPHLLPDGRYVPKLVYSANGSDVRHVVIDGKVIMENHRILSLSEPAVMERAIAARKDLVQRAGQETRDLLAAPWPKKETYWRSVARKDENLEPTLGG
jgi:adenine deaminase